MKTNKIEKLLQSEIILSSDIYQFNFHTENGWINQRYYKYEKSSKLKKLCDKNIYLKSLIEDIIEEKNINILKNLRIKMNKLIVNKM